MKIEELQAHFNNYRLSETSINGVGCDEEVVIRTSTIDIISDTGNNCKCSAEDIVETHYKQVLAEEAKHEGMIKYIRVMPMLKQLIGDDGEFSGDYAIRSRIQFGREGFAITKQQHDHLIEIGWVL